MFFLANAVDDADMAITHVLRGEDLIDSTHRVLALRGALGIEGRPVFAHLPLILGTGGGKLSKRHGAVSVEEYRDNGYLPSAIVNYLALLGWSYDDRTEIMSVPELVERFTLERVGASPAVFDYQKVRHINGVHLRALSTGEYADRLVAYLREHGYEWDEELIRRAAPLVQEKITTLGEFPAFAGFLFARVEPDPDPEVILRGLIL